MSSVVDHAREAARAQLAQTLPRRWTHVSSVAMKAERLGQLLLSEDDTVVLAAAAWLHDVGYAPDIVKTGFHPLDGARWLRRQGFDERVTALVAHHSCATLEAEERGLVEELVREFSHEDSLVSDALWYADMTTGPDGQDFEVEVRLREITARYGPDDPVTRFVLRAEPHIVATVRRTEKRFRAARGVQPT